MNSTKKLIKRLRKHNMTQSEIARRTRIPQPRLSRWENGVVPDAADDALKLAALLDEVEASKKKPVDPDAGAPAEIGS